MSNMADDCDTEIDVMGEYDLDLGSLPNPLKMSDLQSNYPDVNQDLPQNVWTLDQTQNWYLDQAIDEKSRMTIERMLQEERHYMGLVTEGNNRQLQSKQQKALEKLPIACPTHKKPWTQEEKDSFVKGLEIHGRKWSLISKLIGTRTTLQVKNFARQYLKNQAKLSSIATTEVKVHSVNHGSLSEVLSAVSTAQVSSVFDQPTIISPTSNEKNDCTLDPVSYVVAEEIVHISSQKEGSDVEEDVDICDESNSSNSSTHCPNESLNSMLELNTFDFPVISEPKEELPPSSENVGLDVKQEEISNSEKSDDEQKHSASILNDPEEPQVAIVVKTEINSSAEDANDYDDIATLEMNSMSGLQDARPKQVMLDPPIEEVQIDPDVISEEEKQIHKEFFEGRSQKTPDRYLKIRNFIIDSWKSCRPSYLNKTSVRPGLKNCGDVNCIGRIHQYLEQIGAINFGCDQARYNVPTLTNSSSKDRLTIEQFEMLHSIRMGSMRPRKRKQPPFLDEIDVDEGYTMEHNVDGSVVETVHNVAAPKMKQSKNRGGQNPFKLVRCSEFSPEYPEPYKLEVSVEAVVVADIHCHSVHSEVMGLLGGRYDHDGNVLRILTCEACESLSTGVQCEMDPVSQTIGMERLQSHGFQVVGWYHSHPTFVPDPSYRDIETQVRYQTLFENQGQNPFIAMIISPFCQDTNTSISRYLVVGHNEAGQVPFCFSAKLIESNISVDNILAKAEKFFQQSSQSRFKVNMMSVLPCSQDVTYLDVMLNSLEEKLEEAKLNQEIIKDILLGINKLVLHEDSQTK